MHSSPLRISVRFTEAFGDPDEEWVAEISLKIISLWSHNKPSMTFSPDPNIR